MDIFQVLADLKRLVDAAKNKDFVTVLDVLGDLLKLVSKLINNKTKTLALAPVTDEKVEGWFDGSFRKAIRERLERQLYAVLQEQGLSKEEALKKIGDGTLIDWLVQNAPKILEIVKLILTLLAVFA